MKPTLYILITMLIVLFLSSTISCTRPLKPMVSYSNEYVYYELKGRVILTIYKGKGRVTVQDAGNPKRVIVANIDLDSCYVK